MKTNPRLMVALSGAVVLGLAASSGAAPFSKLLHDGAPIQNIGSSDGGSLPGLPGGRGGAPGNAGQAHYDVAGLTRYCIGLLERRPQAFANTRFHPSNCVDYFMALGGDPSLSGHGGAPGGYGGAPGGYGGDGGYGGYDGVPGRAGSHGPSISGGVGGRGGRAGAGPGGGAGGAGGGGVAGGRGGAGGAGGASD